MVAGVPVAPSSRDRRGTFEHGNASLDLDPEAAERRIAEGHRRLFADMRA
ncbi:MAG: hypothetical protein OXG35_17370 [Acidobacteria bacterium]|nr:hypothetical protein [Acidobacteriota bacterium]